MSKTFSISIIGAGNLASSLAPELENAGHIINTISSLNLESAQNLANSLYNTKAIDNTDFSNEDSEIIILAVRDDIISEIAAEVIAPKGAILVHCSGYTEISKLDAYDGPTGVFYPLQSFTKGVKLSFKEIPLCIESYDEKSEKVLTQLARSISNSVATVNSKDRNTLHLAAVFANNFVNHMLGISHEILKDTNLRMSILQPLVNETVRKAFKLGPSQSQTGPAKRNDLDTLQEHLKMLQTHPELAKLYELISRQIIDRSI